MISYRTSVVFLCLALGTTLIGCQNQHHAGSTTAPAKATNHVDKSESHVALADVPPAVRAGFDKAFSGAVVHQVKKETYYSGLVHWEFEFNHNGKRQEAEFDEDGELLPEH